MPKHITLSRRKQSAPLDFESFKEKRSERENEKKRKQEIATVPFDDEEDEDDKKKKKSRKQSQPPAEIINFDDVEEDDEEIIENDEESSSLSVGDVRNEFEALQSKIELGLEDAKTVAKQLVQPKAAAKTPGPDDVPEMQPGVLYIGHLPFGLHERQLEGFLSQFGEVLRVKLARSKRTGGSRHFAFVEFRRLYVARVVVEAMNGYIIYRRRLACAIVPPEKCHARMWSISRNIVKSAAERRARSQLAHGAAVLDEAKATAADQRRAERAKARAEKLAAAGISLDAIKAEAAATTASASASATPKGASVPRKKSRK